jgi:hypothetical protein
MNGIAYLFRACGAGCDKKFFFSALPFDNIF